MANKVLVQLAIDIYQNKTANFSVEDSTKTLREELIKLFGTDKVDYKMMRGNKHEFFTILEEALDVLISKNIETEFAPFAEYSNVKWGDKKTFTVKDPSLFSVSIIADGNNNLTRQRLFSKLFTPTPYMRGVKVYDEFYSFLSGKVDWAYVVNKVSDSYISRIYTEVYTAIYNEYSNLAATYAITGQFNAGNLTNLIQHIEAATNMSCRIYGTKNSLSRVTPAQVSDNMIDIFNSQGFYGSFYGTAMQLIKQVHTAGTSTFALNDSFLLVLPQGDEKLVKIVDEGESLISETAGGINADDSLEYTFRKKAAVGIVMPNKFGIYRLA